MYVLLIYILKTEFLVFLNKNFFYFYSFIKAFDFNMIFCIGLIFPVYCPKNIVDI